MALVTWDRFYPYIEPLLSGCPRYTIDMALAQSARRFCEETHLWRETLDTETTQADEAVYEVIAPGAEIETVLWLRLDGTELQHVYEADVPSSYYENTGKPVAFSVENGVDIRFYPVPDAAYEFKLRVALRPTVTSYGVEDFLFNEYMQVIVDGAMEILLAMPGNTWTDFTLLAGYNQRFLRGVARARVRDQRNVSLRVKPVPF